MNMMKVYDKHGQHVDKFRVHQKKEFLFNHYTRADEFKNFRIRLLNKNGFYVKG